MSIDVKGKKLLILGGTYSTLDIVRLAQSMGIYVIVADDADNDKRVSKQIADEAIKISTTDITNLAKYIKENSIDGVFCGPSEFNIKNMINLCETANINCYVTSDLWDICSNKSTFKKYCKKNNIPTAEEYKIEDFCLKDGLKKIEYPVIVKPVDGSSSQGISICRKKDEVEDAYKYAIRHSKSGNAIIEQYLDNGGNIFSFRYILDEGTYYPYLTFDTYIADPIDKKCLISIFTYFPSDFTKQFEEKLDKKIQNMFRDMGLKNGVAFVQSIPFNGKIYCHEMGYRLSGGMIYKITEPLMGINDIKMMLRYSLGQKILNEEELSQIKFKKNGKVYAQLMIPLDIGKIKSISGLEEILRINNVIDFLQYYDVGDEITRDYIGTLGQHFGRFTLEADDKKSMIELVKYIQEKLKIKDFKDNDIYNMKFDVNRLL